MDFDASDESPEEGATDPNVAPQCCEEGQSVVLQPLLHLHHLVQEVQHNPGVVNPLDVLDLGGVVDAGAGRRTQLTGGYAEVMIDILVESRSPQLQVRLASEVLVFLLPTV